MGKKETYGEGDAATMKPYSKNTEEEGGGPVDFVPNHHAPTHTIHKGNGGISGAGVEGYKK